MQWVEYGKTILEFRSDKLNKVGTVVVIKNNDTGDINTILIGDVTDKFIERGTWPKYSLNDTIVMYKVIELKPKQHLPSGVDPTNVIFCVQCGDLMSKIYGSYQKVPIGYMCDGCYDSFKKSKE